MSPSNGGRKTNLLASTERAVFGATITLVDLATGETVCTAYTGVTAVEACCRAAAECDRLGASWRARAVSTPETILTDLTGTRKGNPSEVKYMTRAGRADLCEFIPAWDGHTTATTRRERRWPA